MSEYADPNPLLKPVSVADIRMFVPDAEFHALGFTTSAAERLNVALDAVTDRIDPMRVVAVAETWTSCMEGARMALQLPSVAKLAALGTTMDGRGSPVLASRVWLSLLHRLHLRLQRRGSGTGSHFDELGRLLASVASRLGGETSKLASEFAVMDVEERVNRVMDSAYGIVTGAVGVGVVVEGDGDGDGDGGNEDGGGEGGGRKKRDEEEEGEGEADESGGGTSERDE